MADYTYFVKPEIDGDFSDLGLDDSIGDAEWYPYTADDLDDE